MFVPGTPIPIAALRYRAPGIVIPPAQYPTALTPILGTFAATGLAATGAADGIERFVNAGFSAWTGDNPDGWTLFAPETGTEYVTEAGPTGQCRIVSASVAQGVKQSIMTPGLTYRAAIEVIATVAGGIKFEEPTRPSIIVAIAPGAYSATHLCVAGPILHIIRNVGVTDATIDNASSQQHRSLSRFTLSPHGRVDIPITTPAAPAVVPFGIMARLAWPSGWYLRVTPNTAGNDFEIVEVNAGTMTIRAAADLDFAASTEYTFGLQCMGNVITGYVNGVAIITYTDPSWLWTNVPHWGIMNSAWGAGTTAFGTITGRAP